MRGGGKGVKLRIFRGVYCAYWREADAAGKTFPRRASLRTADRAEAERRIKDFLKSFAAPANVVGEIYDAYLKEKTGTPGHKSAEWNWKALKPHFAHLRPDQVTRAESRAYAQKRRAQGISDNTIHRELGMLRAALRWHTPQTPAIVELPRKPPPKERVLNRAEYKKLLGAAVAPHVRLFIVLALATAARAGALLDLTWDRVDFDRGIIRLAKGRESRLKGRATVPMTEFARDELQRAQKAAISDYVIEWAGGQVKDIKKGVARASARAGLKDVSPHVLRHTAAVWMAESGVVGMAAIAQYLGHSDSRTTERIYARFSPDYLRTAAAALEMPLRTTKSRSHSAAFKTRKKKIR